MIGMYALWTLRNKRRHGEILPPVRVAVQWVADLAYDLGQATRHQTPPRPATQQPRWECPQDGWLKCNTDGAFYDRSGQGATGAVLRDSSGNFIRGSAKWYDHCLDALIVEALACRDGLRLAIQFGARRVWLESDCQQLIQLWQAGSNQRSTIATVLQEIRELSLVFLEFNFSFIPRNCNKVAHSLAKRVTADTRAGLWTYAPAYVLDALTAYCNFAPNE